MQCGAHFVSAPERDYRTDVDAILETAGDDTKIVFLANPNNPTGTYISDAEVRRLREGLPSSTLLVLDSAYAEFVSNADYSAGIELARERDDVIVTRTFSKIHGMAALRLGWAYGNKSIIDVLHRVPNALRATVGTEDENRRLVAALSDFMKA